MRRPSRRSRAGRSARGSGHDLPVDGPHGELWLSLTAAEFPNGTVYAFRDLTDERAVDQLKSDFVSTVSHELRTPLAAIYGAAMTLQRADVELNEVQEAGMLAVIAGESERLAQIVNDILLASRLDSGAETVIGHTDASGLARDVLAAAQAHLLPASSSRSPRPSPARRWPPIRTASARCSSTSSRTRSSTRRAAGSSSSRSSRSTGAFGFAVRDRGLGIPVSEHERIFEKFFRLDPNLSRGVGGTGLGLYISSEIVRRMGGRIRVESEPGHGSTFWFELARLTPEREEAAGAASRSNGWNTSRCARRAGRPRRTSSGECRRRRPTTRRSSRARGRARRRP